MASDNTKRTETAESAVSGKTKVSAPYEKSVAGKQHTASDERAGVFVYLGPSIRGVISYGTIYIGKRCEVTELLSGAIRDYPQIERLIVEDNEVCTARKKIKAGANLLASAYSDLLKN